MPTWKKSSNRGKDSTTKADLEAALRKCLFDIKGLDDQISSHEKSLDAAHRISRNQEKELKDLLEGLGDLLSQPCINMKDYLTFKLSISELINKKANLNHQTAQAESVIKMSKQKREALALHSDNLALAIGHYGKVIAIWNQK